MRTSIFLDLTPVQLKEFVKLIDETGFRCGPDFEIHLPGVCCRFYGIWQTWILHYKQNSLLEPIWESWNLWKSWFHLMRKPERFFSGSRITTPLNLQLCFLRIPAPAANGALSVFPARLVAPSAAVFCATGHQGFVRNLSVGEIIGQILFFLRRFRANMPRQFKGKTGHG